MQYFHGNNHEELALHIGLCLTDWEDAASRYGREVHEIEADFSGLTVRVVDGYDRDSDVAIGDTDASIALLQAEGVDVVVYDDEDRQNRQHTTFRIISQTALDRVMVLEVAG